MPRTPDRQAGARYESALKLDRTTSWPDTAPASGPGGLRFDDATGAYQMQDDAGTFDPRSGSGLSAAQHQALRQLIHFVDNGPANGFASGAYRETVGTLTPSSVTWYDDATKVKKLVEKTLTYSGIFPTVIEWKMYDTDGVSVLATVTDAIAYSGAYETSRTRTIA